MPIVTIRKDATQNRIVVDPEEATLKPGETLTFRVVNPTGFAPGTRVAVLFRKEYRTGNPERPRPANRCGPFARRVREPRNPREGKFVFDSPGDFETGIVNDRPRTVPHTWKYDVTWGDLTLDPMIRIEKGL
jgi:hypothetical protein